MGAPRPCLSYRETRARRPVPQKGLAAGGNFIHVVPGDRAIVQICEREFAKEIGRCLYAGRQIGEPCGQRKIRLDRHAAVGRAAGTLPEAVGTFRQSASQRDCSSRSLSRFSINCTRPWPSCARRGTQAHAGRYRGFAAQSWTCCRRDRQRWSTVCWDAFNVGQRKQGLSPF